MEMPEGWTKFKELVECCQLETEFHFGLEAVQLMKEMAEAIQRASNQYDRVQGFSMGTDNQLKRVLQKFKEWK